MDTMLENSITNHKIFRAWEKVFDNISMFPEADRPILEEAKKQFDIFVNMGEVKELENLELSSLGTEILGWYF